MIDTTFGTLFLQQHARVDWVSVVTVVAATLALPLLVYDRRMRQRSNA